MKYLLLLVGLVTSICTSAQKLSKADKKMMESYKASVQFLSDDKLEGRRTGTTGEKLAYEFISSKFKGAGLTGYNAKDYIQAFEVAEGKEILPANNLTVNDKKLELYKDYFPFTYSANASLQTSASRSLNENGAAWFFDLKELLENNSTNPHFDLKQAIIDVATKAAQKKATALLVFNSASIKDNLAFDPKDKNAITTIPVIYILPAAIENYFRDSTAFYNVTLNITIAEKKRTGHNVVGYINNNAASTIILGAHYDHLGYGEDHNSLYTGATPMIHNGADDNASGTAALLELAGWLKNSKLKKHNYLFIAFSGEELGLYGSKYFTEHSNISNINYMINMDMIGRLNDSTHGINIGGYGTSPQWASLIHSNDKYFKIKLDSSGSGPSDHTSFYRKDIPVLFFFTGAHSDYHKPTDDADKINYTGAVQVINYIKNIIAKSEPMDKMVFTKTREAASAGRSSFKVSMGIMPDYTFNGNGVLVDGVSEGRAAQKAGVKTGDIIYQLNDYKFSDVQTYMEALSKFNKGDAARVKLKRGKEELYLDIVF
ncbi:MAG: M20/M25/M40 family metallo-hydrolase [Ferruginibacter sp.]